MHVHFACAWIHTCHTHKHERKLWYEPIYRRYLLYRNESTDFTYLQSNMQILHIYKRIYRFYTFTSRSTDFTHLQANLQISHIYIQIYRFHTFTSKYTDITHSNKNHTKVTHFYMHELKNGKIQSFTHNLCSGICCDKYEARAHMRACMIILILIHICAYVHIRI